MKLLLRGVALIVAILLFSAVGALAQEPTPTVFPPESATVVDIRETGDYIYKNSAPLRSGGVGTPIIGFRKEITLISNVRSGCRFTRAQIFDRDGNRLRDRRSCVRASAIGHACRARCTVKTCSIYDEAIRKSGSSQIFMKMGPGLFVNIRNSGKCFSSKNCSADICD